MAQRSAKERRGEGKNHFERLLQQASFLAGEKQRPVVPETLVSRHPVYDRASLILPQVQPPRPALIDFMAAVHRL